ncbi:hypothetical protein JFY47_02260 [Enterobacter asburiae]|jgi:hypothetical protein|uniref:hypothetical protein n=1 Tax=Enterobacter asburiae TaxID=61645 RepID=UPI0018E9B0FE|nr:hypothetical protein [Enterobacter asburiae]MBJ3779351.1 hypothetical protein [Enterobacter asburiae]
MSDSNNVYPLRDVPLSFSDTIKKGHNDGGDGGDNGMTEIIKRIEKLESDTSQIRMDVAVLMARSENFATKSDLESVRADVNKLAIRSEEFLTKADFHKAVSDVNLKFVDIHKEITAQTRWFMATLIGTAGIALAVAKYLFG